MTDLEIIKELELELEISLKLVHDIWQKEKSYSVQGDIVTGLSLQACGLSEIPNSLTKLKHLQNLDISNNLINNPLRLLSLKRLENLSIHLNSYEVSSQPFGEFLNKAKNIKRINFIGSYLPRILEKDLLNHDLLLATRHYKNSENAVFFDNYRYFPPLPLLELGYNNPKFYYENYIWADKAKQIEVLDDFSETFEQEQKLPVKQNIIAELLDKYYSTFKKRNELTYAIRKLLVYNHQGITELFIDNISINESLKEINDPQWIFLTGENGYGKTSLLQALTIGLHGKEEGNKILTKHATVYLEFKNNDKLCVNSIDRALDDFIPFQNFATYGPARLNKADRKNDKGKTYSLFNVDGKLLDIENELIIWEKDKTQKKYFDSAKKILLHLLEPQVEDLYVEREGTKSFVKYKELGDKVGKEFSELASGYRSIIAMIGDIIIRLSENQPEIKNFSELAGIVIIDEIDLHLHPKWQKELVKKLTETFPKIQFIASTHSPIPLLGAPKNTVVINVQRSEDDGITAEKLDVDISELTPENILSSPIFDFQDFIPESYQRGKRLRTENGYDEVEFYKILEEKVKALAEEQGIEYKKSKK